MLSFYTIQKKKNNNNKTVNKSIFWEWRIISVVSFCPKLNSLGQNVTSFHRVLPQTLKWKTNGKNKGRGERGHLVQSKDPTLRSLTFSVTACLRVQTCMMRAQAAAHLHSSGGLHSSQRASKKTKLAANCHTLPKMNQVRDTDLETEGTAGSQWESSWKPIELYSLRTSVF